MQTFLPLPDPLLAQQKPPAAGSVRPPGRTGRRWSSASPQYRGPLCGLLCAGHLGVPPHESQKAAQQAEIRAPSFFSLYKNKRDEQPARTAGLPGNHASLFPSEAPVSSGPRGIRAGIPGRSAGAHAGTGSGLRNFSANAESCRESLQLSVSYGCNFLFRLILSLPEAPAGCPASLPVPSVLSAVQFSVLYRKVTNWARVQSPDGLKVRADSDTPVVMPLEYAHSAASV